MEEMRIEGMSPPAVNAASHEVAHENSPPPAEVKAPAAEEKDSVELHHKMFVPVDVQEKLNAETGVRFSVNLSEDKLQVQIIDRDKNEVIRMIPSEEMLEVMDRIDEFIGSCLESGS